MAFFSSQKTNATPAKPSKTKKAVRAVGAATVRMGGREKSGEQHSLILKSPRITEKASFITEDGAYTFNCAVDATKRDIYKAVREIYGVEPVKIRTLAVPSKKGSSRRGKKGVTVRSGKKALVYLKHGERIEFI